MKTRAATYFFITIILIACVFTSCSIEKRVYRKGYHVVWNYKKAKEQHKTEVVKLKAVERPDLLVSNETSSELIPLKHSPLLILSKDTCGDKLLLQNADELLVKVIEIDDHAIKYKRCDNLSGPTYSIAKSKVALITYVNGTKEVIMNEPPGKKTPEMNINQPQVPKRTNPLGLASLLIYILGTILLNSMNFTMITPSLAILLLLLSCIPLIMAYVSLFQFKREPSKYKGRWMPVLVVCLYLASILLISLSLAVNSPAAGAGVGPFVAIFLLIFLVLLGALIAAFIPKTDTSVK
jgi:hypothetical protein